MSKSTKRASARRTGKPALTPRAQKTLTPDWLIVALAGLGMLITAYLTIVALLGGQAAFCAEGGGCDLIQQSHWSTVLGLPVAFWGFTLYAVLALLAWRLPATLKRWRRLWYGALAGLTISAYLTVVGIVQLGAVCTWCLASLLTISAIFVSVIWRRPGSAPGMAWTHWGAQSALAAVLVAALLHLQYSGVLQGRDDPYLQALAVHLEQTGARYYGAYWCPSCQQQKRLFGAAADNLPFVECSTGGRGSPMTPACAREAINAFPTWIIDGRRYTGVLTADELARHSGFAQPR